MLGKHIIIIVVFSLIALCIQNKVDLRRAKKVKFHSDWQQKMWHSCTSVFPNTCAWDHAWDSNTIKERNKGKNRGRREAKKSDKGKSKLGAK